MSLAYRERRTDKRNYSINIGRFFMHDKKLMRVRLNYCMMVVARFGRRNSLIAYYVVVGVSLILSQVIPEHTGMSDRCNLHFLQSLTYASLELLRFTA